MLAVFGRAPEITARFQKVEGGTFEQGRVGVTERGAFVGFGGFGGATLDGGVLGALEVGLPQTFGGAPFELE